MFTSLFSTMASATIVPQQIHTSRTKLTHTHHNVASTIKAIAHSTQNSVFYSQPLAITTEPAPEHHQIPRSGFIQPFGSTFVVDSHSFHILAHSENAAHILGFAPNTLALGTDIRSLFTRSSAQLLQKALTARQISLTNPTLIHSRTSGESFYAILHRIDAGIVVDLEPALSISGEHQSLKLSELLCLPSGDVKLLCQSVVESVKKMTGYDRVVVYKFHEDYHGEVVAESKRDDLEPFIGLHYPASDIPEASRVWFMHNKNRARMIVNCHASPVSMIEDETLMEPLSLFGSTLRAPNSCHVQYMASMGSIATLVMGIVVGEEESSMKLWGLVICHHASPKSVPFPLRRACESLVQAFGIRLNMEMEMEMEKPLLRT